MSRLTRADLEAMGLNPEQRAELERQLGGGPMFDYGAAPAPVAHRDLKPENVTHRDVKPAKSLPTDHRWTGSVPRRKAGEKTKVEQRFESFLGESQARCEVLAWRYEPVRVVLPAHRATYCGDFLVRVSVTAPATSWWHPLFGALVVVEVKPRDAKTGKPYWREKSARLKWKLAAEVLRGLVDVIAVWPAKGGGWEVERA